MSQFIPPRLPMFGPPQQWGPFPGLLPPPPIPLIPIPTPMTPFSPLGPLTPMHFSPLGLGPPTPMWIGPDGSGPLRPIFPILPPQEVMTSPQSQANRFPRRRRNNEMKEDPNLTPRSKLFCGFCKRNGETVAFYTAHNIRDAKGKTTCPILFRHTCEICNGTGSNGHTRAHCPILSNEERKKFRRLSRMMFYDKPQ